MVNDHGKNREPGRDAYRGEEEAAIVAADAVDDVQEPAQRDTRPDGVPPPSACPGHWHGGHNVEAHLVAGPVLVLVARSKCAVDVFDENDAPAGRGGDELLEEDIVDAAIDRKWVMW